MGRALFITLSLVRVWRSSPQMGSHNEYVYVITWHVNGASMAMVREYQVSGHGTFPFPGLQDIWVRRG